MAVISIEPRPPLESAEIGVPWGRAVGLGSAVVPADGPDADEGTDCDSRRVAPGLRIPGPDVPVTGVAASMSRCLASVALSRGSTDKSSAAVAETYAVAKSLPEMSSM